MYSNLRNHRGFSLVELVVVVMILGILGAVAAPRLLGTSRQAVDNGLRQTLAVIRDAIDRFAAENDGTLPGVDGMEETFKTELSDYLRGAEFPICPVGQAKNGHVRMADDATAMVTGISASAATHDWVYCYTNGEFAVNSQEMSADGATTYDQF